MVECSNVLIIGGGIGGLSAALALQNIGHKVTVFEQAHELRDIGGGVLITPNAMLALGGLGVAEQLIQLSDPIPEFRINNMKGEQTFVAPDTFYHQEKYGAPSVHAHRSDVHAILRDAVLANDPDCIHLEHSFVGLEQNDVEVTAKFANHPPVTGDVLIGCDGCSSKVRTAVTEAQEVSYIGLVSYRVVLPWSEVPAHAVPHAYTMHIGPRRQFLHYSLRHGSVLNINAIAQQPEWEPEGWSVPAKTAELQNLFHDFCPAILDLVEAIPSSRLFKWGLRDREPMDQWVHGRVAMLGDAAHPMTPFLGQGACMAIEDAVIIARAFAGSKNHIDAFEKYERARKDRANGVQLRSKEVAVNRMRENAQEFGPDAEAMGLFSYNAVTIPI
jgi:salicylate hydroxylase